MAGDREQVPGRIPVIDRGVPFGVDRGLEAAVLVVNKAEGVARRIGERGGRYENGQKQADEGEHVGASAHSRNEASLMEPPVTLHSSCFLPMSVGGIVSDQAHIDRRYAS
jgi:hypothetical protein